MWCFHKWQPVVVPELLLPYVLTRGGKVQLTSTIATHQCSTCGKRKVDFLGKVPPPLLIGKAHHWVLGVPIEYGIFDQILQIVDENKFENLFEYTLSSEKPKPTLVKG